MLKKFFFVSSTFLFSAFFLCLQTGVSSCNKVQTVIDTVKTNLTDTVTVTEPDTALSMAILTANAWKIQEIRATYGGSPMYYMRGGNSNTDNFDNEYIKFSTDGTGIYSDAAGVQTTFTWHFTDSTYTSLVWYWNLPQPVIVTWEHIVYNNRAIRYTEYYIQFGYNVLTSGIRIPQ